MARAAIDEFGDEFASIDNRVGPGGSWDDVMVVQGLLQIYWMNSKTASRIVPKSPAVDGMMHKETILLINHFEFNYMKRPKGSGFINPSNKVKSAIVSLNIFSDTFTPAPSRSGIDWLRDNFPKLEVVLRRSMTNRQEIGREEALR